MAVSKDKKVEVVSSLKDSLGKSNFVVVVHYRGMDGKQLYDMRLELKSKGCEMKVAKNTLASIAIKGTEFEPLNEYLTGPTAILCSEDPVALAKVVTDITKEIECLKIQAGFLDNAVIKDDKIKDLAKLGSLEEVRASFLGKLGGVQSNFVRVLQAPQSGLVALFHAKTKQG